LLARGALSVRPSKPLRDVTEPITFVEQMNQRISTF